MSTVSPSWLFSFDDPATCTVFGFIMLYTLARTSTVFGWHSFHYHYLPSRVISWLHSMNDPLSVQMFHFHLVGLIVAHTSCFTTFFSMCTKYFRSVMTCLVVFGNVYIIFFLFVIIFWVVSRVFIAIYICDTVVQTVW